MRTIFFLNNLHERTIYSNEPSTFDIVHSNKSALIMSLSYLSLNITDPGQDLTPNIPPDSVLVITTTSNVNTPVMAGSVSPTTLGRATGDG